MSRSREVDDAGSASGPVGADRAAFVTRLHTVLRHWPRADRLAKARGVSPSAFRKWLKGEAEPSRERLVALAEAAAVSVGWLARGEVPEPRLQRLDNPSPTRGVTPPPPDRAMHSQEFLLLPKRPEAAAAGPGSPSPPLGAEFIGLRRDWIRSVLGSEPDRLRLETAVSGPMLPGIEGAGPPVR